jgi:hypothetical protein
VPISRHVGLVVTKVLTLHDVWPMGVESGPWGSRRAASARATPSGLVATAGSRYLQPGTISPAICYRHLFTVPGDPERQTALARSLRSPRDGRPSRTPWARVFDRHSRACSQQLRDAFEPSARACRRIGGPHSAKALPLPAPAASDPGTSLNSKSSTGMTSVSPASATRQAYHTTTATNDDTEGPAIDPQGPSRNHSHKHLNAVRGGTYRDQVATIAIRHTSMPPPCPDSPEGPD